MLRLSSKAGASQLSNAWLDSEKSERDDLN